MKYPILGMRVVEGERIFEWSLGTFQLLWCPHISVNAVSVIVKLWQILIFL